MSVAVRFAPSPTGFLHIGGARTALFNWLFARHHGGIFRLRIEDTDRTRSTPDAVAAIIDGLEWLGLSWDEDIVYQSARAARHAETAEQLLAAGRAYYCYCTPAELEAMRQKARAEKRSVRYDGTWRDRDPTEAPPGVPPVIRLKAPQQGSTTIRDHVQGDVTVSNTELDDLIILRADGSPTYNLSVVVDDHDMAITHVIRGDDHLNNALRQTQIYQALDWPIPEFAHVPLIHGPDGTKMSKRHGAVGIDAYRDLGYLPEALRNYLLRLGWSHGDDEIISTEQAIKWFNLDAVGRAPARFDFAKLDNLNGHYIRISGDSRLSDLVSQRLEKMLRHPLPELHRTRLLRAMPELKLRPKTLAQLAVNALFLIKPRPIGADQKAAKLLTPDARELLSALLRQLDRTTWQAAALEARVREFTAEQGVELASVAQPLRAALTGSVASPSIFEVMELLGRDETLGRIADAVTPESSA
ncbi:MAG: glutamate--tRNA ligase [Alphaproteobacteria bacterium]|nr:glutamate--tRNA ligase [Alphaproteobacteria bacterium]